MASDQCLAALLEENKELKKTNTELVEKLQHWKITAAQREDDKILLMKEVNHLRLKLSRLRNGGSAQARALHIALQSNTEEAVSCMMQASNALTRSMEASKTFIRDHEELETYSPRWSAMSSTPPSREKIKRVAPLMMGGQSIQPMVFLSRTNISQGTTQIQRTPTVSRTPLPMHQLQDLYIPLRRIDSAIFPTNNNEEEEPNDSIDELAHDESEEGATGDLENIPEEDEIEASRTLDASNAISPIDEEFNSSIRNISDNPLEGPSWLYPLGSDAEISLEHSSRDSGGINLEPDSTTDPDDDVQAVPVVDNLNSAAVFTPTVRRRKRTSPPLPISPPPPPIPSPPTPIPSPSPDPQVNSFQVGGAAAYTPTVRRRKRTSPPPPMPSPSPKHGRRSSKKIRENRRVLQVVVCKMPASEVQAAVGDAPSPHGATDTSLIRDVRKRKTGDSSGSSNAEPGALSDSHSEDGESGAARPRRPRKAVTYKEKPLNKKLRR